MRFTLPILSLLLLVLIAFPTEATLQLFGSKPGDPEIHPSIQLILRNIGIGSLTDPIFNSLRRRWEVLRSNPLLQALLVQSQAQSNIRNTRRLFDLMGQRNDIF